MSDSNATTTIKNARQLPKKYYGLHFYPGVAEYQEPGKAPYRIFVNEATLRQMDSTFEGRPVYVKHVDEVNLDKLQAEADGFVTSSFYNEADGKHWVEFLIVSDKGHQAVQNGWKLSNAYYPDGFGPGGVWNGVEYVKEVTHASFEHLAIVSDPRYNESIILTPTQFKTYNESLALELRKVANSKEDSKGILAMFKFFKKTETEHKDLESTVVTLTNGTEVSIGALITAADKASVKNSDPADEDKNMKPAPKEAGSKEAEKPSEAEDKKQGHKDESQKDHEAPMMANMDHHVMVQGKACKLGEVMDSHHKLMDCMNTIASFAVPKDAGKGLDGGEKDADPAADKTKRNDDQMDGGEKEAAKEESQEDKTKRNAEQDGGEKEADKQAGWDKTKRNDSDMKDVSESHFMTLKNAPNLLFKTPEPTYGFPDAGKGKARYGSDN